MSFMSPKKQFLFFASCIIAMVMSSCVEDIDFDQTDDIMLTPVVEFDFIYSNFKTEDYLPDDVEPNQDFFLDQPLQDTINFDLTSSDFSIDNLERIELTFEASNQIERNFELQFQFLSENGEQVGELFRVPIRAGNGADEEPTLSFSVPNPIILDKADLEELQNADRIASELLVPELNTDLRGTLKLRSKATYYFNIATNQ